MTTTNGACAVLAAARRTFFENMYAALIACVADAVGPNFPRTDIENDMGTIFRSRHFNMYERMNAPHRPVNTLSVTELHALKVDTAHRALHAKLLSRLNERPVNISMQVPLSAPLLSTSIMMMMISPGRRHLV